MMTLEEAAKRAEELCPGADLYQFDSDRGPIILKMPDAKAFDDYNAQTAPGAGFHKRQLANAFVLAAAVVPPRAELQVLLTELGMFAMSEIVPSLFGHATGAIVPPKEGEPIEPHEYRFGFGVAVTPAPSWLPNAAELAAANPKAKLHAIRTELGAVVLAHATTNANACLDRWVAAPNRTTRLAYEALVLGCAAYPDRATLEGYFVAKPEMPNFLAGLVIADATGSTRANAAKLGASSRAP